MKIKVKWLSLFAVNNSYNKLWYSYKFLPKKRQGYSKFRLEFSSLDYANTTFCGIGTNPGKGVWVIKNHKT